MTAFARSCWDWTVRRPIILCIGAAIVGLIVGGTGAIVLTILEHLPH